MRSELPVEELSEKLWEQQAVGTKSKPGLARMVGWEAYHTLRSKGSEPGFPDWTLMRERVIFLELKRESGKPTPAQKFWIKGLLAADAEVYIARPSDLQELSTILGSRARKSEFAYGSARYKLREQTRAEVEA